MVACNAVSFILSLLILLPLAVPVAGQCVDHGRSLRVAAARPVAGEVGASARMGDLILLSADGAGLTVFDLAIPEIPWYIELRRHVAGGPFTFDVPALFPGSYQLHWPDDGANVVRAFEVVAGAKPRVAVKD